MEIIKQEEFDAMKVSKSLLETPFGGGNFLLHEKELKRVLAALDKPIEEQKELAARVNVALQERMKLEMQEMGVLSDSTRKWVDSYNQLLDSLQRNQHGMKTEHIHTHKISHAQISNLIRNAKPRTIDVVPEGGHPDADDAVKRNT